MKLTHTLRRNNQLPTKRIDKHTKKLQLQRIGKHKESTTRKIIANTITTCQLEQSQTISRVLIIIIKIHSMLEVQ